MKEEKFTRWGLWWLLLLMRTPLKQSSRKMGIQAVWGDDRTDTLWGFLPQMVSNDCVREKCEFYLWYHSSLQPSNKKQSFPWGTLMLFFSLNEMLMIVWMIEGWLPQAIIYLLEIQPILICISSCLIKASPKTLCHYCFSSGIGDNSDNNRLVLKGIMKFILLRHILELTSVKLH